MLGADPCHLGLGLRLRDVGVLLQDVGLGALDVGGACVDGGLRLVERYLVLTRVEPHQRRAGLHRLVVGHVDIGHIAADLGRHGDAVGLQISVVGAFDKTAHGPPAYAPQHRGDQRQQSDCDHNEAAVAQTLGGWGGNILRHSLRRHSYRC